MTKNRVLRNFCSIIVLFMAALVSIAMFAEGCNTTVPPNRQVSDLQITAQVKAKLASGVGASSLTNVDVNTTNGVVTLAGQVESAGMCRHKRRESCVTASVLRRGAGQINTHKACRYKPHTGVTQLLCRSLTDHDTCNPQVADDRAAFSTSVSAMR